MTTPIDRIREQQRPFRDLLDSPLRIRQTVEYEDVNQDPDLRNRVVRWYYVHLRDQWLYTDPELRSLAQYFKLAPTANGGQRAVMVSTVDGAQNKPITDDDSTIKKLLYPIRDHLLSKRRIAKVLEAYADKHDIKWWDLQDDKYHARIRHYMFRELKRKITKSITSNTDITTLRNTTDH